MVKFWLKYKRGFSFWPFLVLPQRIRGTIQEVPYLEHETTHYRRQAWWSPVWVILYFCSKRFRMREETLAFSAEVCQYQRDGIEIDILLKNFARTMATGYWGMCSYTEALVALNKEIRRSQSRR